MILPYIYTHKHILHICIGGKERKMAYNGKIPQKFTQKSWDEPRASGS